MLVARSLLVDCLAGYLAGYLACLAGKPPFLLRVKARVKARFKARVKARVKAVRIFLLGNRTFPIDDNPNSNRDLMTVTCSQV